MSCFTQYKLKDGRKIRGRYYIKSAKVCISRTDLEELIYEVDVAYEQAKQLQTIIENLAQIKRQAITKVLNELRAEIIEMRSRQNVGVLECLDIIDKYRAEGEKEV